MSALSSSLTLTVDVHAPHWDCARLLTQQQSNSAFHKFGGLSLHPTTSPHLANSYLAKNQAAADRAFKPNLHPIAPQRAHLNQIFAVNPQNLDRPIAVEIDRRPYSSSNFPRACKNVNLHPPFHIPCVILIIVNTGMTLRTQVLSVTLAMG